MSITIGEITFPNNSPNFNQIKFKGVKNFEFNSPRNKKIIEIGIGHILGICPWRIGHNDINKKTTKKSIPKLLLELPFTITKLIYYLKKLMK